MKSIIYCLLFLATVVAVIALPLRFMGVDGDVISEITGTIILGILLNARSKAKQESSRVASLPPPPFF